jgi:light-regulated signal transduction histidine kinase (bacteriophytochrome)
MKGSQVVAELSEVDPTSDQWLGYIQSRTADLKNLIPCDGFLLRLSGEILTAGMVPDASDRKHFIDKICTLAQGKALSNNGLNQLCDGLGKYSELAAGVIAIPLSASHDDIAIWMRADQKQTVRWAGDPLGNIESDSTSGKRLCVRESFDIWTRVTEKKCLPWTEQDLRVVTSASMQIGLLALSWHAAQASQAKTQFLSCMSHCTSRQFDHASIWRFGPRIEYQ